MRGGRRTSFFAAPYLVWMIIFIVAPLLLIAYYAFTTAGDGGAIAFTLDNLRRAFSEESMLILWRSVKLAFTATLFCLLIGYPAAYILSRMKKSSAQLVSMFFIIPMWLNFLLRTYAWRALLDDNGLINQLLTWMGLPAAEMLYTEGAVVFGLVYTFLPFMILPILTCFNKMNHRYLEAAEDLGANKLQVFSRIVLPLSVPGMISGITMVFMPAVTTFIVSTLLGGSHVMMYGDLIEFQFMRMRDWGFGSALAVIMMVLMIISMAIMRRTENGERGSLY